MSIYTTTHCGIFPYAILFCACPLYTAPPVSCVQMCVLDRVDERRRVADLGSEVLTTIPLRTMTQLTHT